MNIIHWLVYAPRRKYHGEETRLHRLKWQVISFLRIYEFKVKCDCGNTIYATDGVVDYEYICKVCAKKYTGTKRAWS